MKKFINGVRIVTLPLIKKGLVIKDKTNGSKFIFVNSKLPKTERSFVINSLLKSEVLL